MSNLKVVSICPVKGLSELDRIGCQRFCDVLGAAIVGMEWYALDLDGEPYVAFTSQDRPHWNYYLKKAPDGWYVEHQPDDVSCVPVTKGHLTARAACGAAAYYFRGHISRSLAAAETLAGWWWEAHTTPSAEAMEADLQAGAARFTSTAS